MKNTSLLFLTIILFGLSAFFRKLAVDRIHPYQLQIVAGLVYALEVPIWLWLLNRDQSIGGYTSSGVGFGVLCIVTHVIAAVMFGFLMKSSNSTGALATMVAMNPIVTSLLSAMILGEQFTTKKIIATIVTLAGISLFTL